MTLVLRLTKDEKLTFEELDGNFTFLSQRITNLEVGSINWQEAYSWGNHSLQGYLTYYEESDPVFTASPAYGISDASILKWNSAFDWGNHALAGYLTTLNNEILGSLFDVDLTAQPSIDNVLKWNGEKWIAGSYDAFNIDNNDINSWNLSVKQGDNISLLQNDAGYITAGLQTGDNVSELVNDANYMVEGAGVSLLQNDVGYLTSAIPVIMSDSPPVGGTQGDLWWDTTTGILKIFYLDAESGQWVDAVPQAGDSIALPNEDYVMYGTAGAAESQNAIAEGSPLQTEASTDLEVSVTVSGGRTRTFIHFSGYFYNTSDPANYSGITLQRELNGSGTWNSICKHFAVSTNGSGGDPGCTYFSFVDTHGATDGDVVAYRWINSTFADNWGSVNTEAVGQVFNRTGDVFSVKEI